MGGLFLSWYDEGTLRKSVHWERHPSPVLSLPFLVGLLSVELHPTTKTRKIRSFSNIRRESMSLGQDTKKAAELSSPGECL